MQKRDLAERLERAVNDLFEHQPNIWEFTSETNQTEWNLAHHLAVELAGLFPKLDCDLDVAKPNYDMRRPDIILHNRGSQELNRLVIEVKKDGTRGELAADLKKIRQFWFSKPLNYRFGAVINLCEDGNHEVIVIKNVSKKR